MYLKHTYWEIKIFTFSKLIRLRNGYGSVSQAVYTANVITFMYFLSLFWKLIRLKKLMYILRLNKYLLV